MCMGKSEVQSFVNSVMVAVEDLVKGGVEFLKNKIEKEIKNKLKEKVRKSAPKLEKEIEKNTSLREEELKKGVERIIEDYQPLKEENKIITKFFKLLGEKTARAAEKKPPEKVRIEIEIEWIELFNPYETPCQIEGWQIKTSSGTRTS